MKKNDAIAIAKEKKAILDSSNLDFYIIGHPNFKDGKEVIQKCTCGKVCEPENLKEDCRNRNDEDFQIVPCGHTSNLDIR